MSDIIEWCNDNQGFLSAVLSITTVLISVLNLRFSYKIGKMPFKRKIYAEPSIYTGENGIEKIKILIVNHGLSTEVIHSISIKDKLGFSLGGTKGICPITLKPSEHKDIIFNISDENGLLEKNALDLNGHLIIEIYGYNRKKYKITNRFPVG